jgi:hypothetical protein
VVHRAHVDVVDVEQETAVGAAGDLAEKLPLGHRRVGVAEVARDVLDQDPAPEPVLHAAHALHHVRERLLGIRQRQEVVRVVPADAPPAEVVRDPRRLDAVGEVRELGEVGVIQRIGRTERQRHAVQHDRRHRPGALEHAERAATPDHEVFGDRLEPVGACRPVEHLRKVAGAQADAVSQIR